jgi:outer membrane protein OmpA-like peptidoglycan-associated protein
MNTAEKNVTAATVRGVIIGAAVGGVAGAAIGRQMDTQAEELAHDLPGITVRRVGEGITVTFPAGLLFGSDSDRLTPAAADNLRRFAASLTRYPHTRAVIVAYTDANGSAAHNVDLSDRRALATASYVSREGVDRARICTAGRGQAEPIATNRSDAGRRLNRRVEIAIVAMSVPGRSP